MPGMQVGFRIDDAQVRQLFTRAPQAVSLRLRQLIEGAAIDVQREMRIVAPIAVTGNLRRSVRYTFNPARLHAIIEPVSNYAESVEKGSEPRFVSVAEGSPLREWAKLKGINPFALQASIARKGTKAHPFVKPTYDKMKPKVERDIAAGLTRLVEEMDRGGV